MAKKTTQHFTLLIIGGGPIGLACALEAKKARLNYLVLEKGCLVNSLFNYPTNMTFFSTSERLEIGKVPFISNNPKPNRAEALEYYRRVTLDHQVNIQLFEEVTRVKRKEKNFSIQTTKGNYTADYVIIATGFYDLPFNLNVPGEELQKVTHYYKDPHYYGLQKVLVVGAQNSAVDAALETWRKGAEVTMIIRQKDIGERVKYWVRPDIMNRIKEGSIKAYFFSSIIAIREKEVEVQTPEGRIFIPNDWVIALTGYKPNLDFLQKAGIHLSDKESMLPAFNNKTHETNIQGLYLAGVICGGMDTHTLFIENSRIHAKRIISDVMRSRKYL